MLSDDLMKRQLTVPLISLGLAAILVHGIVLFLVIPAFTSRLMPFYGQDGYIDGYDLIAANLVAGNGYRFYPATARTLMREPGYPMLLAGIRLVFGSAFVAVKLVNMLLALAVAWMMTLIARRLSSNQTMILAAPLLYLFHPGTIIAESRGGVEILFTSLITLFMLTLYRAIEHNRRWDYVVSGAVLGLAVVVKSTPLLFPIVLLIYFIVCRRGWAPKLAASGRIVLMVITTLVVLSPWIIRNYELTGQFVPTASVLGVSAHAGQYICMHLDNNKSWMQLDREAARERAQLATQLGYPFEDDVYYQSFYNSKNELQFSAYLMTKVVHEYKMSPMLFVRCVRSNMFNFWCAGKTVRSTRANIAIQLPYLVLAIMGVLACVRNGQASIIGLLVVFIIYFVAVYVPILAQARYSMPLIPFLSIFAGCALAEAYGKLGRLGGVVVGRSTPVLEK